MAPDDRVDRLECRSLLGFGQTDGHGLCGLFVAGGHGLLIYQVPPSIQPEYMLVCSCHRR